MSQTIPLKCIAHNPYRVLGVYANATLKEVIAMKAQIKAYANIGQTLDVPLRLSQWEPQIEANEETIAQASSQIVLPADRHRHKMFWFTRGNSEDDSLIELLNQRSLYQAKQLLINRTDPEGLQNSIMVHLLEGEWKQAVHKAEVRYQEVKDIRLWIEQITEEGIMTLVHLQERYCKSDLWLRVVKSMRISTHRQNVERMLDEAQQVPQEDGDAQLHILAALIKTCDIDMEAIRSIMGEDSMEFQTLADNMQQTLWSHACYYLQNPPKNKFIDYNFIISVAEKAIQYAYDEQRKKFLQQQKQIVVNQKHNYELVGKHILGRSDNELWNRANSGNDSCVAAIVPFLLFMFVMLYNIYTCEGSKSSKKDYQHQFTPTYKYQPRIDYKIQPITPPQQTIDIDALNKSASEFIEKHSQTIQDDEERNQIEKAIKQAEEMEKQLTEPIHQPTDLTEPPVLPDGPNNSNKTENSNNTPQNETQPVPETTVPNTSEPESQSAPDATE